MTRRDDARIIAAVKAVATPKQLELGPAPTAGTPNGVASILLLKPDHTYPNAAAVTVKREDDTWGTGAPYGAGQAFEVLSPSTQAASDLTGDGIAGSNANPVLFRIDRFGGLGLVNGVHVAPGLRDTHGGPPPIGIWVQLFTDTYGLAISLPDPALGAISPALLVQTSAGKALAGIDAAGQIKTYADNGTTPALGLYPGNAGVAGYRAIFTTQAASTGGVAVKTAASQTAAALAIIDSGAKIRSMFAAGGDLITLADDGATNAAGVYAGSTAFAGYRGIFNPITPGTGGVAVRAAASQTAPLLATFDSSSDILSGIDAVGSLFTADDTGVEASGIYPRSTSAFGYRSILRTVTAATGGLAIKAATSQTAMLLAAVDTGAHVRAGIDALFSVITYNDTGATPAGAIYSGTTPAFGYRSILSTLSASTGGLAIKLAASQSAPALVVVDGSGTSHTIIDSSGALVGGGGGGVTSFQGRTGAVSLTLSDVTGTGLDNTDIGAAPADSAHSSLLAIAGVSAPSNTTTPAGWFQIYIPSNGQLAKVPIYQ